MHQELAAVRQQQAAAESRAEALGVDLRAREAELAVMKVAAIRSWLPLLLLCWLTQSKNALVYTSSEGSGRRGPCRVASETCACKQLMLRCCGWPQESALQLAKELGDNKRKAAEELENLERERTKRRRLEEDNKVRLGSDVNAAGNCTGYCLNGSFGAGRPVTSAMDTSSRLPCHRNLAWRPHCQAPFVQCMQSEFLDGAHDASWGRR